MADMMGNALELAVSYGTDPMRRAGAEYAGGLVKDQNLNRENTKYGLKKSIRADIKALRKEIKELRAENADGNKEDIEGLEADIEELSTDLARISGI